MDAETTARKETTMKGDNSKARVATEIRTKRGVYCRRWVPGFARACGECGTPAPATRLDAAVRNFMAGPWQGGDVEKTLQRSAESAAKMRARLGDRIGTRRARGT